MSVSIEDKITLFSKMIFTEIEEYSSEKKLKAAEGFEQEKKKLLEEVESKRKAMMQEAEKRAEKDKKQLIAKAKAKAYHQLLETRQRFIEEVIELLLQEAGSFVSGEGYREYLSKCFVRVAADFEGSDSLQLYFTKRDLEVLGQFINQQAALGNLKGRCVLLETGQSIIGGFYAEDSKHEMQIDYTLKSLIEENRELVGGYISRRLDEVQGNGK